MHRKWFTQPHKRGFYRELKSSFISLGMSKNFHNHKKAKGYTYLFNPYSSNPAWFFFGTFHASTCRPKQRSSVKILSRG